MFYNAMKFIQLIVLILICNSNYAQETGTKMVDFSPKSGAYSIYHPDNLILTESNSSGSEIVTISNPENGFNLTISSYANKKKIGEEDIMEVFGGFLGELNTSDWKSYKTKFDNLIEGEIVKDGTYWMWYGISMGKKLVILSVNKDEKITEDEINLVRFMIDNLEIH